MSRVTRAGGLSRDAHAFLAAVGIGFIAMFGLKLLSAPQLLITAIVAGVVVAYAIFVYRAPGLKLRLDQAGDNAYYLGLIFTLLSMAWSLWMVGQVAAEAALSGEARSVVELVIGDFGLALGSTLAGIVCRIVLHQMRVDPVGVEEATRLELAVAAEKTRSQLADISSQLAQFFEALRQKSEDGTRELQEGYQRTMAEVAARVAKATETSVESMSSASEQMRASVEGFSEASREAMLAFREASERLAAVEPPPTKLSQRYGALAERVAEVSSQLGGSVSALSTAASEMEAAARSIASVSGAVDSIAPMLEGRLSTLEASVAASGAKVDSALGGAEQRLAGLANAVEALGRSAGESASLVVDSERSAAAVLDGLERAIDRIAGVEGDRKSS